MRFDDPCLVERIKSALQALFQKQMLMNNLGIKLSTAADPFAASALFTSAFEFTWQIARSARNPSVVLVDPMCMPVMAMKTSLLESDVIFSKLREVLPDFLAEKSGRVPLPKARWKDLWASEPSSVADMEKQLVKLVEQVLWVVGTDPSCQVSSVLGALEEGCPTSDPVPFEPWMESGEGARARAKTGDSKKRKKQQRRQRCSSAAGPLVEVASVCSTAEGVQPLEEEDEEDDDASPVMPTPAVTELLEEEPPDQHFCTDEANQRWEEEALSDDESVGMGTMHFPGEASVSEVSCEPTAASTPSVAHAKGKRFPLRPLGSPTHSPLARHQAMSSKQLVCYIWNQASQCAPCPSSPRSTSGPPQGQGQAASPFTRGQWTTGPASPNPGTPMQPMQPHSPVLSAVVRKTFLDIDDPSEYLPETVRASRSLSPPRSSEMCDPGLCDPGDSWSYHWWHS